jgi:hemoglobin
MDETASPFDRLGGADPIARLVERFYELMDGDPAYAGLRAMHAPDLAPMVRSLTGFLIAWTGGPRDWFAQRPDACIMSAHGALPGLTRATADQWIDAMTRALTDCAPGDEEIRKAMLAAMAGMCEAMAARADALSAALDA